MTHIHKLLLLAFAVLMLGSCDRTPKNISDINDASPADSMMYYFGIMQAYNYLQDAESDTILKTDAGRDAFISGFKDALKMEKNDASYNKGLQLGLRLAIRLREFSDRYGMEFPEDILAASFANAIKGDTIDIRAAQEGFYLIKDRLDLRKASVDIADAKEVLSKTGMKNGFEMISDTLFGKDVTPAAAGPRFKDGDRVAIEITVATADGRDIEAKQFPDSIEIGAGRVPRVVCLGIHTMTDGQTRRFMTTPRTLFGKRYSVYGLNHDEPVVFTVKAQKDNSPAKASSALEEELDD